jgi:hypothetical protein
MAAKEISTEQAARILGISISTAQAAHILGISTHEVRKLIEKSKLEAQREMHIGAPWLVSYNSVLDYKQTLETARKGKR